MATGVVTTSYYLGGQLVATREGTTLRNVHHDSLGSTSFFSPFVIEVKHRTSKWKYT
jgi:hypothetical protein